MMGRSRGVTNVASSQSSDLDHVRIEMSGG
jgi:hypothetical protein